MTTLRDQQIAFVNALMHQDEQRFFSQINDTERLSKMQRLAIYRHNISGGFCGALQATYPVCQKLVGEDFFTTMAHTYIQQTPSTSPNLNDYGESFAAFITSFSPAAELPYLADVARLEWAWHVASFGPDAQPFDVQALAALSPAQQQQLRFQLQPNAILLASDYPIHHIWEVNQEHHQGDDRVSLDEGGDQLIIWRQHLIPRIDRVDKDAWRFLQAILHQVNFAEFCAQAEDIDIVALLPKITQQGWIGAFSIDEIS